jgi:hypothetical protein
MMAAFFRYMFLLLALGAAAVKVAGAAEVDAWLDRTRVAEGETVQLTLEAQGQVSGQPDTTALQRDFDILGISTGSRISIVNGRTDARTTWTLTLSPKHGGTLRIPALQVGSGSSPALTLVVSNAPAPAASSNADIFIETKLEPRQPYVQQQVLYTVRLLHAVPVTGGRLSEPQPANTLVQQLGDDRHYATTRNGRRYEVTERRYALFPQGSGKLELAAPVFDGEVRDSGRSGANPLQRLFGNDPLFGRGLFDDMLSPGRRMRVRGQAAELDVQPRPALAGSGHWLPAQQLTLQGTWQPDGGEITAGEPLTLLLDIRAEGLTAGQLPNLAPAAADGFNVYPDQAQRRTDSGETGVTGHLRQKIAFIPQHAGKLVLPEIKVSWWDIGANRERLASLPARVLDVVPAAGQSAQGSASAPDARAAPAASGAHQLETSPPGEGVRQTQPQTRATAPSAPWPWVSAALGIAWLVTLLLWWRHRRDTRTHRSVLPAEQNTRVPAGAARKQFLKACHSGDAGGARAALLDWAAAHWPDDPPRGLQALAQRLDDAGARAALTALDRSLYAGSSDWDGARLAACLTQLPPRAGRGERASGLAPLYPHSGRSWG